MDRETRWRLGEYLRNESGPIESNLIEELASGELDRGEFLRRASLFGLSASVIGTALAAFGETAPGYARPLGSKAGGRIHVGIIPAPTGAIEPHTFVDVGGLETGGICGEFLTRVSKTLTLVPELATGWTPNADASIWTFKLRPGVRFQSGQTLSAEDVVATYNRLVDPKGGSQALSAFQGVLSPGGITKVDALTVQFHLDAPTASFPYLTSSTTYQGIILPADYQVGSFTAKPQTTGAFKLVSYTPGVGAKYDRYDGWWGGHAPLDGVDVTYYSDAAASDAALLSGQIDLIGDVVLSTDRPLFNNPNVQIFSAHGATHVQVPLRVDRPPFKDYRVRQAIALSLDRPAVVKTLFSGFADIGNDSPFAPVYPSTNKTVAQRHKDVRRARQLLAAAGHQNGVSIHVTTLTYNEVPKLAQIMQRSLKAIGIKMGLTVMTPTAYFGGTPTTTPWLNAPATITGWSHRAVPNVFLSAALKSHGVWNAAHYANKRFDSLTSSYLAAIALADQRRYAKQIETLLLHDTPVIFPYFNAYLQAGSKRVKGFQADALGHVYLSRTSLA
jgi:peptide/nickel transport system substrate-binding protein